MPAPTTIKIPWRGSVSDLITDLASEMYASELCELRTRLNANGPRCAHCGS